MKERRVGIVGSRRRNAGRDREIVNEIVLSLLERYPDEKIVVVSGACEEGADRFAADAARALKEIIPERVDLVEYPAKRWPGMTRWEFTQQAYLRNRTIAEDSHEGYALVADDRTGGTENTVDHYRDLGKTVRLVDGDGRFYLEGGTV